MNYRTESKVKKISAQRMESQHWLSSPSNTVKDNVALWMGLGLLHSRHNGWQLAVFIATQ